MGDVTPNEDKILTFDQLLRQRAVDFDQTPLLAYPKSQFGVSDYELITGAALNRFVDGAAKALLKAGFKPVYEDRVIGVYAPTDLDYLITIFGLGRLGYTPFLLSPRLPVTAVASLLTTCNSTVLFHSDSSDHFARSVRDLIPSLTSHRLLTRGSYGSPDHSASLPFNRENIDLEVEHQRNYVMLHSSGSTGLPKPICWTNKGIAVTFLLAQPHVAFLSVPFYHGHGLVTYAQAIYARKTLYLMNGYVPQTHDTVTQAIVAAKPETVWTVPYVLKLLAEKQDGIDALKNCRLVSSTGSRCPDDLGDLLVGQGVHLGLTFGSTETAGILSSIFRPREDKAWNFLRPLPHVRPYLIFKPVDGDVHEAIVLDGHKAKAASNSDDPPNSFHTSDLFIPHASIPNAWKFVGRLDDRITLLNGEKVLPLPIEGRIRQNRLVREAVMFGIDREVPGLLLFRSENAAELDDEAFLDKVWPVVQDANSRAEGFSQISREMVAVLGEHVECPLTDKSSIKRAQVYREFATVIEDVYDRIDSSEKVGLQLSPRELETWILENFEKFGNHVPDAQSDFFTFGVDSLKAIQMRSAITKNLDLAGNRPSSMIVYDCGNAERLAAKLYAIRMGNDNSDENRSEIEVMETLIDRYSTFEKKSPRVADRGGEPKSSVIVLTGATGSLGSHILAQLIENRDVSKIYCLIRASPNISAADRLKSSLEERDLPVPLDKVIPLSVDLSKEEGDFGLLPSSLTSLKSETTHIIHCAWEVNFALSVQSFEPQIRALHKLIKLSLSTPKPAHFMFCSSISTALATPPPAVIPQAPIPDLRHASATGYACSKLIGERIVENAASQAGAHATILRIGQIIPARNRGSHLWNTSEAVPLMVRSAFTTGALPEIMNGSGADSCTWLEADVLAESVLELSQIRGGHVRGERPLLVYNLVHPRPFSWKKDFLPQLIGAGLEFDIVPWDDWVGRLRDLNDEKDPSLKLLGFWEEQASIGGDKRGEIQFDSQGLEKICASLRDAVRVVDGDFVQKLVNAWKMVW